MCTSLFGLVFVTYLILCYCLKSSSAHPNVVTLDVAIYPQCSIILSPFNVISMIMWVSWIPYFHCSPTLWFRLIYLTPLFFFFPLVIGILDANDKLIWGSHSPLDNEWPLFSLAWFATFPRSCLTERYFLEILVFQLIFLTSSWLGY